MAAYATPADLVARYDARTLGDLAADGGLRVSEASLLTDDNIQAALDDASGEIEAALLQGQRYTVADLAGLTGNSAKYLARITCQIAFGYLWGRRPWSEAWEDPRNEAMSRAKKALELLRTGENIFDVQAVKDAGVPESTGPTRVEIRNLNSIVDRCRLGRNGYYPVRVTPNNR
jgi:phage gp36-like protein